MDLKVKVKTQRGTDVTIAASAGEVAMQRIELGPSGTTGWHTHPGPAVAVIQSGSLTIVNSGCEEVTYVAGQAFVDPGQGNVHIGRNPSATDVTVVFVTYFDVGAAPAGPRIDVPAPGAC